MHHDLVDSWANFSRILHSNEYFYCFSYFLTFQTTFHALGCWNFWIQKMFYVDFDIKIHSKHGYRWKYVSMPVDFPLRSRCHQHYSSFLPRQLQWTLQVHRQPKGRRRRHRGRKWDHCVFLGGQRTSTFPLDITQSESNVTFITTLRFPSFADPTMKWWRNKKRHTRTRTPSGVRTKHTSPGWRFTTTNVPSKFLPLFGFWIPQS